MSARGWTGVAVGVAFGLIVVAGGTSCAGFGQRLALNIMTDMDLVRAAPGAREAADLAPRAFAFAEQERVLSKKTYDEGDEISASLHADRAIVAYNHTLVLARMVRAARDLADATRIADANVGQLEKLAAARVQIDGEADALERQVQVAHEKLLPTPSGSTDLTRDETLRVAARALAMQAHLLCGSARLLVPDLSGLADAEQGIAAAEIQIESKVVAKRKPSFVDTAARARADCLGLLTKLRRTASTSTSGQADGLLAELSASGGWDPSRDERGVVFTLRDAFTGGALTADAERKIRELGRVAAAHPTFAVQIVVHDAAPPSATELAADEKRADATAKALVAGGANAGKIKAETAGAKVPVVDGANARLRARNARIEIVFITPGT